MIGLSLSFCVKDILAGKVREEDVERIEAGTKAVTDEDWDFLIRRYCEIFWKAEPERAAAIVQRLRAAGKIDQPRARGEEAANISAGHWIDAEPQGV